MRCSFFKRSNLRQNVPGTFQRELTLLRLPQDQLSMVDTWLEFIVSPAEHVTIIPPELDPDTAAPLLCGAVVQVRRPCRIN
jgi:hypothetical protein